MKIFKKIFSSLAAFAMIAAPVVVASSAVNAVAADPTSINITREVHDVSLPVINTFTYTVEEDGSNPETGLANLPASFTIAFNGSETITSGTATKTGALDLSQVSFTKVGDYKFKITETGSTNGTSYPLDTDYWYAYVSVRWITSDDPGISSTPTANLRATTIASGTENADDGTTSKGPILFESAANFTHIELSKTVTGNLADVNEYFTYEIDLGTGLAGKTLTVSGSWSKDGSTAAIAPNNTIVLNASGKATIYLKHGDTAKIGLTEDSANGLEQIPIGTQYTIAETKGSYKTYIDGSDTEDTDGALDTPKTTVATSDSTFVANNTTSYMNNKEADPITGIFVNYWPFMLLIALGILGTYIIKKTSKKNN